MGAEKHLDMDLFGCIFIKVAVAIRKLKACIRSKINEKDTKKEITIFLKASQELIA